MTKEREQKDEQETENLYAGVQVLELLEGEKTLNKIASHYDVLPSSLKSWKKQFLQNASLAFDKSSVVQEYKEKIDQLEKNTISWPKKWAPFGGC